VGRLALNRERVGEGIPVHFSFDSFGVSEIILIFAKNINRWDQYSLFKAY
jgi:hypothetical protein